MITLSARYAIKAVMHLARGDGWVGSEELARITGIPSGYLTKVLQRLALADILRTQRGMHGGYRLRREANAISLWDIIQAIDRPPTGHICQSCADCLGCGADQVLAAIEADMVRSLRANDIGSMVAKCRDHATISTLDMTPIHQPSARNPRSASPHPQLGKLMSADTRIASSVKP
ncbi:MAG: Rrf2 family transcriptional regulator [Planctomycetes bacterium]|nr:Rrf2 family transcriptional regulator [Planctomycetota bacterium]